MKKPAPRKPDAPASKRVRKASKEKRSQTEQQKDDSDDIERALYDGMQDLRTPKRK